MSFTDPRIAQSQRSISVTSQSDSEDYGTAYICSMDSVENNEPQEKPEIDGIKQPEQSVLETGNTENMPRSDSEVSSRTHSEDPQQRSRTKCGGNDKSKMSTEKAEELGAQFVDTEKKSAEMFIEELTKLIPDLLTQYSVTDVDECLQQFASSYADSKYY